MAYLNGLFHHLFLFFFKCDHLAKIPLKVSVKVYKHLNILMKNRESICNEVINNVRSIIVYVTSTYIADVKRNRQFCNL